MNWITTNIRLPEELYREIKEEALKERKSMNAIIRERLSPAQKDKKKRVERLLKERELVANAMEKENKGIDLTKALIEMRYEQ